MENLLSVLIIEDIEEITEMDISYFMQEMNIKVNTPEEKEHVKEMYIKRVQFNLSNNKL